MKKSLILLILSLFVITMGCKKGDDGEKVEKVDVKIDYSGGKKIVAGDGAISFWLPDGWQQQGKRDMWLNPKTNSSVNIQKEATSMKLAAYLDLSLKNMKKGIPSYKLITKKIKNVNGQKMGVLLGKMEMYNQKMTLYSVVTEIKGTKYVLTAGGLTPKFEANKKTFDKIVDSYKAE